MIKIYKNNIIQYLKNFFLVMIKFKFALLLSTFLIISYSYSSPVGKGLSCIIKNKKDFATFNDFRGLYFETNESVRVVIFKNKNNSLKIISKQTPFKATNTNINFKIKFIWYGNISFENFVLDRNSLTLHQKIDNQSNKFECKVLNGEFMNEMNKFKSKFQIRLKNDLNNNKI